MSEHSSLALAIAGGDGRVLALRRPAIVLSSPGRRHGCDHGPLLEAIAAGRIDLVVLLVAGLEPDEVHTILAACAATTAPISFEIVNGRMSIALAPLEGGFLD
jgi:hypothetical protein